MDEQKKDILRVFDKETEINAVDGSVIDYIDIVNFQLREPVTNIFALLPLLAENINTYDTEKAMDALYSIYEKSYSLMKSVNNMSVAAKLLGGREFKKENIDFSSLVKSVFESSKMVLPDWFSLDADIENGCNVKGNNKLLTLMIFNILLNSFDYRREDDVQVTVKLKISDRNCVITYCDNSLGIKPEIAGEIFNPYFSKNPYNNMEFHEKMGLGLYIAQQAVQHAGGTIFMQTEFSEGVKYIISIPLSDEEDTGAVKSSAREFMLNKYSEMYVQLCDYCTLPDLQ